MFTEKDYRSLYTIEVSLGDHVLMKCKKCGDILDSWTVLSDVPDMDILNREYKSHIKDCGK